MRRPALALLLLASLPAAAFIPSVGSLFRRAAVKADDIDRGRPVTLRGTLKAGDAAPMAATLQLRFPLSCRLQTEGDANAAAIAVRGGPGDPQVEEEGRKLGAARELLALACPLLTYKGGGRNEGERVLRDAATAAGAQLSQSTMGRLGERVAYVVGALPQQLDVPQLWIYKDDLAPARLLAKRDGGLADLRLLEYGTSASAVAFPRVIELWRGGALAARFEALEAGSHSKSAAGEDDDRE